MTVDYNQEHAVQDEFTGAGTNSWILLLSDESKEKDNMTQAHFDINSKRIATVPASTVRFMMMPHYVMFLGEQDVDGDLGEAKWNAGEINEESDLFKAYVAQCQAYKDAGTRVIFNWGGAATEEILPWFGIKNVPDSYGGSRSAPRDLEQYAVMFAKTLKLLREKYGLTNVDTVNYHNEITMNNFAVFGDKRIIWTTWLRLAHEALVAEGLRDQVKVIGLDAASNDGFVGEYGMETSQPRIETAQWLKYLKTNALDKGYIDYMSIHIYLHFKRYTRTVDDATNKWLSNPNEIVGYKKMCADMIKWYPDLWVTEYAGPAFDGTYSDDVEAANQSYGNCFETSRLGQFLAQVNTGWIGSNQWGYFGGRIPSPLNNYQNWNKADKSTLYEVYWNCISKNTNRSGVGDVNAGFGEMGLLHRYVPKVNVSLGTTAQTLLTATSSSDVRFAAFTQQTAATGREDITFVVEANKGTEKNIEINVDAKYQGKKFNKFYFEYPTEMIEDVETERFVGQNGNSMFDANAVLTPATDFTLTDGKIVDSVKGKHTMIVYTTMDEAQQVYFEDAADVEISVKKGESHTYSSIKTEGLDDIAYDIEYSILTGSEYAEIDSAGKLTIKPDAPKDEWISVKVAAKGEKVKHEAYAVSAVKITE